MDNDSLQEAIREGAVEQLTDMTEEERAELEGTCVGCGGEAEEGLFCEGCSGGLDALERAFSDCEWEVTYNDPDGEDED